MKRLFLALTIILSSFTALVSTPVSAATQDYEITANSGGTGSYQGNFQPGSITVNEGDTINLTFLVPENDPYCCGIQITGNGGELDTGTITPGQSQIVTFTATSSFGFTSYWPGTGAVKATGSVNVTPSADPVAPAVPPNLIGNEISTTQIRLQWDSTDGATAYKVYRDSELIATTSTLFYDDSSLTPSTTYLYKLQATDGNLDSDYTEEISVTTMSVAQVSENNVDNNNVDNNVDNQNEEDIPTPAPTGGVDVELDQDLFIDSTQRYIEVNGVAWGYDELPDIKKGDMLEIFGRTVALADVTLTVVPGETAYTAVSDDNGYWSLELDSSIMSSGTNSVAINITHVDMEGVSQEVITFNVLGDYEEAPTSYTNSNGDYQDYLWIVFIVLGVIFILVGFILGLKFVLGAGKKPKKPSSDGVAPSDMFAARPASQLDRVYSRIKP